MNDRLYDILIARSASGQLPMHMPGHKRDARFGVYPFEIDLTEIDGLDDKHRAHGVLRCAMERAARLYGSDHAFFLVGGSTCGILAGIRASTRRSDTVIVARNCHISVFHAIELCGLMPVFVDAERDDALTYCGSISPASIESALSAHPEAKLVILTSPTYEGVLSDIQSIAEVAHAHGAILMVDEAHGAHLYFSHHFPEGALRFYADIVVQSLHKTLPALTQSALLHLSGARVSREAVERELRVFETSSPSYVLMASMDDCIRLLSKSGEALSSAHAARLDLFLEDMRALRHLRTCHPKTPAIFLRDPAKLIISTDHSALDGAALSRALLEEHNIQCEMAHGEYALCMTTLCDRGAAFERLKSALMAIDKKTAPAPRAKANPMDAIHYSEQVMPLEDAVKSPRETVSVARCAGRISGEVIYAYPPGVPILLPGQRIDPAAIAALTKLTGHISVVK